MQEMAQIIFTLRGQGLFLKEEQLHPKTMKKMWRQAERSALVRTLQQFSSSVPSYAKDTITKERTREVPPYTPPSTPQKLKMS